MTTIAVKRAARRLLRRVTDNAAQQGIGAITLAGIIEALQADVEHFSGLPTAQEIRGLAWPDETEVSGADAAAARYPRTSQYLNTAYDEGRGDYR
jgi:hypothetical protein